MSWFFIVEIDRIEQHFLKLHSAAATPPRRSSIPGMAIIAFMSLTLLVNMEEQVNRVESHVAYIS
jgi:hypothetical protein